MGLKIAVIGAASSYTPELFADLIDFREELEVGQIALMDPNEEKLALIADLGSKLLQSADADGDHSHPATCRSGSRGRLYRHANSGGRAGGTHPG